MSVAKRTYVATVRGAGSVARLSGLLDWLDRRRERRFYLWLRSLFAIYDIDQLVELDLPWWTFQATSAAEQFLRDRPNASVFEYGSGASTVWLARRAKEVVSVEHDTSWAPIVRRQIEQHPNAVLQTYEPANTESETSFSSSKPGWEGRNFEEYVRSIERADNRFDLIVIDGRCRVECLNVAMQHLLPDGLIVFDNAGRKRYRAAFENCGMTMAMTRGLTACLPYPDATALMSHNKAVLDTLGLGV